MEKIVKICGLSTLESVALARDEGASHLGFIFFSKSPRNVTPQQASSLAKQKGKALSVAVTVNADDEYLDEIVQIMDPDILQLHGAETVDRVREIKQRHKRPVMKALSIRDKDDLAKALSYEDTVDLLLLDAKPPEGSQLPGGNGVSFDWTLISDIQSKVPVLLSGGIDLGNVADAKSLIEDGKNAIAGLDVSSGVESAPGVKDSARIKAFLAACH